MTQGWQPIEKMVSEPIWVLKYNVYFYPEDHPMKGNFCDADTQGAQKFTSCHGWYESEADAIKVRNHFQNPSAYTVERVWKRVLI